MHLTGDSEGFIEEATLEVGCGEDVTGEEGTGLEGEEGVTLLYGFVPAPHLKTDLGEGFSGIGGAGGSCDGILKDGICFTGSVDLSKEGGHFQGGSRRARHRVGQFS